MVDFKWDDYQEDTFSWDQFPEDKPQVDSLDNELKKAQLATMGSTDVIMGGTPDQRSLIKAAEQGLSLNLSDELKGALQGSIPGAVKTLMDSEEDQDTLAYKQARDIERQAIHEAQQQAPLSFLATEIGSSLALPIPGAGSRKLGQLALESAGLGAVAGAGASENDKLLSTEAMLGAASGATAATLGKGLTAIGKSFPDIQTLYQKGKSGVSLMGEEANKAIQDRINKASDIYLNAMETLRSKLGQGVQEAKKQTPDIPATDFVKQQLSKIEELTNTGVNLDNYPKLKQLKSTLESLLPQQSTPIQTMSNIKNQVFDLERALREEAPSTFGGLDIGRSTKQFIEESSPQLSKANKEFTEAANLDELIGLGSQNLTSSQLPMNQEATAIIDRQKLRNFIENLGMENRTGRKAQGILSTDVSGKSVGIEPKIEELKGLLSQTINPDIKKSMMEIESFLPQAKEASEDFRLAQKLADFNAGLQGKIKATGSFIPYGAGSISKNLPGVGKLVESAVDPETIQKIGTYALPEAFGEAKEPDLSKYNTLYTAPDEQLNNLSEKLMVYKPEYGLKLKEAVMNKDTQSKNAVIFSLLQNPNLRKFLIQDGDVK